MNNPLAGKHTCTYRGKLVRIVLRNGGFLIGRFKERTKNKRIILSTGSAEMNCVTNLQKWKGNRWV